jgi:hypothetical protein
VATHNSFLQSPNLVHGRQPTSRGPVDFGQAQTAPRFGPLRQHHREPALEHRKLTQPEVPPPPQEQTPHSSSRNSGTEKSDRGTNYLP